MIFFVFGCAPIIEPYDDQPDSFEFGTEQSDAEMVLDSFLEPYGLGIRGSELLFTDAAAGELWQWTLNSSEAQLLESGLGKPTLLASNEARLVIYDSEGLQLFYGEDSNLDILAEDIDDVGTLLIENSDCFLTLPSAGELRHYDLETGAESILLSQLEKPFGLASDGAQLWIGTQDDQAIWAYNIDSGAIEQILSLPEVPYGLDNHDDLWIASRSTRWPYGGWIYQYDGTLTKVSDSPPEAKQILGMDSGVVWSSKQSITYKANDALNYETLGLQTAVGSMLIHTNTLYWTDRQSGRLYRASP